MKYLKTLGPAVITAAVLMVIAGPASATTLTSPAGTHVPPGTTIHAEAKGHTVLDSLIGKIECNSTWQGKTVNTGGNLETVVISIEIHNHTGCTTASVHTLQKGTLEIHAIGNGHGTVTSTGTEWTVETFGLHCIFKSKNTHIGVLTGGNPHATLDISGSTPREGGRSGAFCGSSAPSTGSYTITTPTPLFVS